VKNKDGSAVVVGRAGPAVYLLTAAHVVEGADRVEIRCFDQGKTESRVLKDVTVLARTNSAVEDLALLRVAAGGEMSVLPLRKGKVSSLKTPQGAFSAGFGESNRCIVNAETIVAASLVRKAGADEAAQFWKCRGAPTAGRSGGPLLDADGRLLGLCSGADGKAGYYVHLSEIRRFLTRNGLRFLAE